MVSSARQMAACFLTLLSFLGYAYSQTDLTKDATAVISGKVTIKGKAASGIPVIARAPIHAEVGFRGITDQSGNYREAEAAKVEIEFKPCENVVEFPVPLKRPGQ